MTVQICWVGITVALACVLRVLDQPCLTEVGIRHADYSNYLLFFSSLTFAWHLALDCEQTRAI